MKKIKTDPPIYLETMAAVAWLNRRRRDVPSGYPVGKRHLDPRMNPTGWKAGGRDAEEYQFNPEMVGASRASGVEFGEVTSVSENWDADATQHSGDE